MFLGAEDLCKIWQNLGKSISCIVEKRYQNRNKRWEDSNEKIHFVVAQNKLGATTDNTKNMNSNKVTLL